MEAHQQLTIGLFGFGVVGEGLYKVLQQTPSLKASIKKVCIKHPKKKRNAPLSLFTDDKNVLLDDPDINVIVEVINESGPAFEIVSAALKNGKGVVSASKKMIAEHLDELLSLQKQTGLPFLYEAAVGASIPIIRNLEEYYDNDLLHSIKAIVNGSTNFILTKMFEDRLSFRDALLLAQQLGFAESDPSLDVEGFDAANKWTFLLTHAYGIVEKTGALVFNGIQDISAGDAGVAREKNFEIKLVAQARKMKSGKVAACVLPGFVTADDPLAFVKNEFNGVVIESGFSDIQFFYGKGAGSFPTASAILSDLSALRYAYRYEYKKLHHHQPNMLTDQFFVKVYLSFRDWKYIPKEKFEVIEEWHVSSETNFVIGVLAFAALKEGSWWKENGNSLILMPEPFIEQEMLAAIKKNSLAGGSPFW